MNDLFFRPQKIINTASEASYSPKPKATKLQSMTLWISLLLSYRSQLTPQIETPTQKTRPKGKPKPNLTPIVLSTLLTFWLSPYIRSYWSPTTSNPSVSRPKTRNLNPLLPVQTMTVGEMGNNKIWRSYTGTTTARRQSSLSLERPGKIVQITVDAGDRVTAGTPIAYIDTQKLLVKKQELLARREQLTAQLQELKTGSRSQTIEVARLDIEDWQHKLELSRLKQQRRQKLYQEGAISLELLDEATTEAKSHQARFQQAQNKLNELKAGAKAESIAAQQAAIAEIDATLTGLALDLEQSILKAPFTGTIAKRLIDEGTVISAGQPIVNLVEQQAEARIGVPVAIANRLIVGSEERLQIGSRSYRGKVLSILPELDPTSRTATVVFGLEDAASTVRVGQIAQLKLAQTLTDSGYWLPTTALTQEINGLWTCYVLGAKTTKSGQTAFSVERRYLETIHTQGDRVLVRGTLQPGEQAIVSGTHRLVPNLLVQPVGK